jgi:hypothetical protein
LVKGRGCGGVDLLQINEDKDVTRVLKNRARTCLLAYANLNEVYETVMKECPTQVWQILGKYHSRPPRLY